MTPTLTLASMLASASPAAQCEKRRGAPSVNKLKHSEWSGADLSPLLARSISKTLSHFLDRFEDHLAFPPVISLLPPALARHHRHVHLSGLWRFWGTSVTFQTPNIGRGKGRPAGSCRSRHPQRQSGRIPYPCVEVGRRYHRINQTRSSVSRICFSCCEIVALGYSRVGVEMERFGESVTAFVLHEKKTTHHTIPIFRIVDYVEGSTSG